MWRPVAGVMLVGALTFAVSAQGGPRVTDGSSRTRKTDSARQVTGPVDSMQSVVAGDGTGSMVIALTPKTTHPNAAVNGGNYNIIPGGCYSNANIAGQTLTLTAGGPCLTYWNVELRNWQDTPRLRSYQGRVDAMTYSSGAGAPLENPAVPCANLGSCTTFYGEAGAGCSGGMCTPGWTSTPRSNFDGFNAVSAECPDVPTWSFGVAPAGVLFFGSQGPDIEGTQTCSIADVGQTLNGGTLAIQVPAGAKGVYTIGWVDNETFYTGPDLIESPMAPHVAGVVVIPTGSCCFGVGGPQPGCVDDVTQAECAALAPVGIWSPGDVCDNPPTDDGCCACISNADCNDGDACTNDSCSNCVCSNVPKPSWNQATECCDANTGNECTPTAAGVCDTAACSLPGNRGVCQNTLLGAGVPCGGEGDDNPCTYDDICDGASADGCSGTDVNGAMIPCTTDADCLAETNLSAPTCVSGFCNCSLVPDLTVEITDSGKADPNCFDSGDEGAKVVATVHVAAATAPINGGQFLITYDPTCLEYNSAVGVAPYTDQVFGPIVDEGAGTIFTVVGVGFGAGNGPAGNADMLELSFTKIGDCNSCQICFSSNNPQNTYLADANGQRVSVNALCSKPVVANNELTLDVPDTIKINKDCGEPTGSASWASPSVEDSCGNSTLTCTGIHQDGTVYDANAMNGGEFHEGVTNLCCVATSDWCDKTAEGCWTVEVNDQTGLDIEIGLSPSQQAKVGNDLTRCIKFTLYKSSIQEPFSFEQDITFGGQFDFVGKSEDALKIPGSDNWMCITAWDQLHTLRSCYLFGDDDCVGGRFNASFVGDPNLGGNWLIGGNLDGWKKDLEGSNPSLYVIDVLDYATFASQWGVDYGSGDTPCGTPGPNADINGDGLVTLADYAFISMNFLKTAKVCCDPDGDGPGTGVSSVEGITEISVRELREMGLGDLAAGDLNGDGILNVEDMNAFQAGARPEGKGVRGVRKGSGTR
jgi:hypothetical protein